MGEEQGDIYQEEQDGAGAEWRVSWRDFVEEGDSEAMPVFFFSSHLCYLVHFLKFSSSFVFI